MHIGSLGTPRRHAGTDTGPGVRRSARWSLIVLAVALLCGASGSSARASHPLSACGHLLEYAAPPGADPAAGLGSLRIALVNGELAFFFHLRDASNAPALIQPGATQIGAFVCVTGTHVESASPVRRDYVALHRLTLAVPTSLPSTSTAPPLGMGDVTPTP